MKILKIETLGKGWQDRDILMLHACFQILSDFVEKEMENVNWNCTKDHKRVSKKILALYSWWKDRPFRKDVWASVKFPNVDEIITGYDKIKYPDLKEKMDEAIKLDQEWDKEDKDNLHRLVELRMWLWT